MAEPLPLQPPGPWTPAVAADPAHTVSVPTAPGRHGSSDRPARGRSDKSTGGYGVSAGPRRNCPTALRVCKGSVNSGPA